MRTPKEIATEIAELRQCLTYVPHFTSFGDDNHEKINAQIRVLGEQLTEEQCADIFLHGGEIDEDGDPEESNFEVESCAREASQWLFEEKDVKAPHLDWESLKPEKRAKAMRQVKPYQREVILEAAKGGTRGMSVKKGLGKLKKKKAWR